MRSANCSVCGAEFRTKKPAGKYCGRECFYLGSRRRIARLCGWCGRTIEVRRCKLAANRGLYCGRECYASAIKGDPRLTGRPPAPPRIASCDYCRRDFALLRKGQRFCGKWCSTRARIGTGSACAALSPLDAAYIAGLFDGEGTVSIWRTPAPQGVKHFFKVQLSNTNLPLLGWLQERTGVGSIRLSKPGKPNHKPCGVWACCMFAAAGFARQLLPHLRVKREQAETIVEFQRRSEDASLGNDREWRESAYQKVRALNRRGL